jgi:hypothetical protein
LSIKEILDGDPVPTCWHEPMTQAEKDALSLQDEPGPDGYTWYWKRCLTGVGKDGKVQPGGIGFTESWDPVPNDPVKFKDAFLELTVNQAKLIQVESRDGQIPYPVAGTSPSAVPRVNQHIAFFDGTDHEVTVSVGAVLMRARVESLTVHPEGEGGPVLECQGPGVKVEAGDTPASKPDACWYQYKKSSAGEPEQMFAVPIEAHWGVDIRRANGSWVHFNDFTKKSVTQLRVTEIQALVVN